MIYPYEGQYPRIHPTVFMTDQVAVLAEQVGVWFGSVIRGDVAPIRVGARTNVQDNCTLHVTWKKYPLHVGEDVTIGHGAILHGCTVNDRVLIGMHATVLDNAVIGDESLIAAGTVVLQNTVVPEGVLFAGVPGKIIRTLSDEERSTMAQSAGNYLHYIEQYRLHRDLDGRLTFDEYLERFAQHPVE
jgi:gamma-carbonic anhydrase